MSAAERNEEFHLKLKMKVLGLADKVRSLSPPHRIAASAAPTLREGSPSEADMAGDTNTVVVVAGL